MHSKNANFPAERRFVMWLAHRVLGNAGGRKQHSLATHVASQTLSALPMRAQLGGWSGRLQVLRGWRLSIRRTQHIGKKRFSIGRSQQPNNSLAAPMLPGSKFHPSSHHPIVVRIKVSKYTLPGS